MMDGVVGESPTMFPFHPTAEVTCHVDRHYDLHTSLLCGVVVLLSLMFLFYGYRLFKLTLFLTGFMTGFFALYIICNLYMDDILNKDIQHKEWVTLGVAAGCGLLLGLLTLCCFYVGLALLGAALGWFLGMAFLPVLISMSPYVAQNSWVSYVVLVSFAVLGAIAILLLQKVIIIISTSFLGAYATMQALDYFIEKGQITFYVLEILYYGKTNKMPKCWFTWFVLAWIPAIFILGVIIQFRVTGKQYDHRSGYVRRETLVVVPVDTQELEHMSNDDNEPLLDNFA